MIEDSEVLNILVNEYTEYLKKTTTKCFQLFDYNFDENLKKLRLEIIRNDITKTYNIYGWYHSYHDVDEDDEYNEFVIFRTETNYDGKCLKNIRDVFEFLLFHFRSEYKYSKITDKFELKDKIEYEEKLKFSFKRLCENKIMDTCCVCYEYNNVYTTCNHNLCRLCYEKIKIVRLDESSDNIYGYENIKECPMCRSRI